MEQIHVEAEDLETIINDLSTASNVKPDLVFVGCPHCSAKEIAEISRIMEGRRVNTRTEFWVCTSRSVKEKSIEHVNRIEAAGGHVLIDMCTIVSWTEMLGIRTIMTNSAKTAYYARTLNKAETIFAPLKKCLKMVLEG